jgi:hypothetical protein
LAITITPMLTAMEPLIKSLLVDTYVYTDAQDAKDFLDFGLDERNASDTHADPVILYSGRFALTIVDVEIASRGMPLRFDRTDDNGGEPSRGAVSLD